MKVYVSADIEGCCGATTFEECSGEDPGYAELKSQMTRETASACRGAFAAGADRVLVKDAHMHGRNLIHPGLPEGTELIRGWSGAPTSMVQELDETFDALVLVGWHAGAADTGNPLAHTMSSRLLQRVLVDGEPVSELHLHVWLAGEVGVPLSFVSGDARICEVAEALVPGVRTVAVKRGIGASTVSMHPATACKTIEASVRETLEALAGPGEHSRPVQPPTDPVMRVEFKNPSSAYRMGWYPGAEQVDPTTVEFRAGRWVEAMGFLNFAIRA